MEEIAARKAGFEGSEGRESRGAPGIIRGSIGEPHFSLNKEEVGNRGNFPSVRSRPGHLGLANRACSLSSDTDSGKIKREKLT